jgi:hypothetical protein
VGTVVNQRPQTRASACQARAHRPDRHSQRRCDLLIAEPLPGVQQQHVALIGIQLGQQLSNANAPAGSPIGRTTTRADRQLRKGTQRTTFGPRLIPQQVRRDPKQPGQSVNAIAKRRPALERNRKRPGRNIIRAVAPKTPGEVAVNLVEVTVEQHRKRLRAL